MWKRLDRLFTQCDWMERYMLCRGYLHHLQPFPPPAHRCWEQSDSLLHSILHPHLIPSQFAAPIGSTQRELHLSLIQERITEIGVMFQILTGSSVCYSKQIHRMMDSLVHMCICTDACVSSPKSKMSRDLYGGTEVRILRVYQYSHRRGRETWHWHVHQSREMCANHVAIALHLKLLGISENGFSYMFRQHTYSVCTSKSL